MQNEVLLKKIDLVVDRLLHLGSADYDQDKSASREDSKKGLIARDFGIEEWDWPQGVGLYGLCKLQNYYGDNRYLPFLEDWFAKNIEKGLPSKNINTTAPFLALMELSRKTENPVYRSMCLERAEWLMQELPKTEEGGFQHVTSAIGNRDGVSLNEGQIWADTLFMAVLFLNQAGQYFNRPDFVQESVHQFLLHIKYLYDKQSELFHHGWTFHGRHNFGNIFWCRGNSWFTYGVMDYLSSFDRIALDEGSKRFLLDTYQSQVSALLKLQDQCGLWHTVLDDPDSYCEVSGTAAITAGILKGMKSGLLNQNCKDAAEAAVLAICDNVAEDGTVLNVSAGTGIGMDKEHYKNIMINPMAYGQSLTLLALTEALA